MRPGQDVEGTVAQPEPVAVGLRLEAAGLQDRVQAVLYRLLAAGPRVGFPGDRPAQGAGDRPQGLEGGGEPQLLQRLGE